MRPETRIYSDGDRVVLDIRAGNLEAAARVKQKKDLMRAAGGDPGLLERSRDLVSTRPSFLIHRLCGAIVG